MYLPVVQLIVFIFLLNSMNFSLGFIRKIQIPYTKVLKMETCFPEDEDNLRKTVHDLMLENWVINEDSFTYEANNPIYTLLWYDCEECRDLLENMGKLQLSTNYMNGETHLYDFTKVDFTEIKPLLFKDSEFIGDNLYDIYEEIYKN